jgi:phage tail-like protein
MSGQPTATSLGLTVMFNVTVDGLSLGDWSRCEGLEVKAKLEKMHDPGDYSHENIYFANVEYEDIKLTRAVDKKTSKLVQKWVTDHFAFYQQPGYNPLRFLFGETAAITLFDSSRTPLTTWNLHNVYPRKYKGPTMSASKAEVATETLELAHEGFE